MVDMSAQYDDAISDYTHTSKTIRYTLLLIAVCKALRLPYPTTKFLYEKKDRLCRQVRFVHSVRRKKIKPIFIISFFFHPPSHRCFCSENDDFMDEDPIDDDKCDMECSGDPKINCGGWDAIYAYQL